MLNGEQKLLKNKEQVDLATYDKEKKELLTKISKLEDRQSELEKQLAQTKTYCDFYAKMYTDLKMEFMQTKHVLLKGLNVEGVPDSQFVNTANGLSVESCESDDEKSSKELKRNDGGKEETAPLAEVEESDQ